MIIPHSVIRAEVRRLYDSGGLPKGDSTGWKCLDDLYTVAMHQWTVVTGIPHSGKSEWLDAMMVNLAKQGDWRFFIYSPENQPLSLHHAKIMEKYLGMPFNPGPTQRLEPDDLEMAEDWMDGKFYFCKPEKPEMEHILVEGIDRICRPGCGYKTGIVIDPWNFLEHHRPGWMSETEYVSDCLSRVIDHVREHPVHLWLVAHPAKQMPLKNGSYSVPTPRDIAGSAHFWNKADNCVTIHRDQSEDSQDVEVHIQKVRFKHIGRLGNTTLKYDRITGRYFEPRTVANYYEPRG